MATEEDSENVISREDAIRLGLSHYYTGKPCKRGHLSFRTVSGCACKTCSLETLNRWRKENREYVRKRDNEYKRRNADRFRELDRKRYAKNPNKFIEKTRVYYQKNKEELKRRRRENHFIEYEKEEVRKRAQERTKKWAQLHPEKVRNHARNGKAKRKNSVGSHTASDITDLYKAQKGKCAYCKISLRDGYHVDHIVPIARGGTNYRNNLQLLCAPCNLRKGARDPIRAARSFGMLI